MLQAACAAPYSHRCSIFARRRCARARAGPHCELLRKRANRQFQEATAHARGTTLWTRKRKNFLAEGHVKFPRRARLGPSCCDDSNIARGRSQRPRLRFCSPAHQEAGSERYIRCDDAPVRSLHNLGLGLGYENPVVHRLRSRAGV